jgi:hypothetical protein
MSRLKSEDVKLQVIELDEAGVSQERIAELTGVPRSTVGDFLRKETFVSWWASYDPLEGYSGSGPKMMSLDIETAPQKGYFWGRFNQNIGANQVIENSYMLSWAAKDFNGHDVEFDSLFINQDAYWEDPTDDKRIVKSMFEVLDEADIIIAHNGDNFDIKKIIARGVIHGLTPPSPFRKIDTLKIARRECKFDSNRLDELDNYLGVPGKDDTGGMQLWIDCMGGVPEAWEKMLKYNIQDIRVLEDVYKKIRHYDSKHPNIGQYYRDGKRRCTVCGSAAVVMTGGVSHTNASIFQEAVCGFCTHPLRIPKSIKTKEERLMAVVNG